MSKRPPPSDPRGQAEHRLEFADSSSENQAKDTIAVALGHRADGPESPPKVLATGRGEFAEIILDIAFRNGIKVREDADLAEILATADLDSEIPVEAFIAVAEILRYVYASNSSGVSNNSKPTTADAPSRSPSHLLKEAYHDDER